ncbi:CLUMA_CG007611, isoform A [Clunio marinus]|uniref:CLUMA_CG007611, isoform A n=1 Tax=Clunio marinus TaxID=568069 RepID=A0A1J1I179_9DIPT|nr:CLUMA_CG007611, isoform A [Clunio marinus]
MTLKGFWNALTAIYHQQRQNYRGISKVHLHLRTKKEAEYSRRLNLAQLKFFLEILLIDLTRQYAKTFTVTGC